MTAAIPLTTSLSFKELAHNLHQIGYYSKRPDIENLRLLPGSDERELHSSNSFIGFFRKIHFFFIDDNELFRRIRIVVQRTHLAYYQHIGKTMGYVDRVEESIGAQMDQPSFEQSNSYLSLANKILHRTEVVRAFYALFQEEGNERLITFFQAHLDTPGPDLFSFGDYQYDFEEIRSLYRLSELGSAIIPFRAIYRLAIGEPIPAEDVEDFDLWVKKLQANEDDLEMLDLLSLFDYLLQAFTSHIARLGEARPLPSLPRLLHQLAGSQPRENDENPFFVDYFLRDDETHCLWRDTLHSGSEITCNGRIFHLGAEIAGHPPYENHNRVFSVEEDPNSVLVVSQNQAIQFIRGEVLARREDYGVRPAQQIEVDRLGRCAIWEKLPYRLSDCNWTTDRPRVSREDKGILKPVLNQVIWLKERGITPKRLDLNYLMFDREGVLKTVRPTAANPFSFIRLEKLFDRIAKGNRWIFAYLMDKSSLYDHPNRHFFHRMIEHGLKNKKIDVSHHAAVAEIGDCKAVARGKKLMKQVRRLKADLIDRPLTKEQLKWLNREIVSAFEQLRRAGTLSPHIREVVLQSMERQRSKKGKRAKAASSVNPEASGSTDKSEKLFFDHLRDLFRR